MAIDGRGGLAIAQLTYFLVAFPFTVWICIKQGFGRQAGWFYLASVCIARIIGAACEITVETQDHPSNGLYTAVGICSAVGLVPLLLCLVGMLTRVNDGMPSTSHLNPQIWRLIHLTSVASIVLAIIAGVDLSNTSSPSDISTGRTLRKPAACLILAVLLGCVFIMAILFTRLRDVWGSERRLLYAGAASVPFLLVRIIYFLISAFNPTSSLFNAFTPNVFVQAFLQVLEEFVVMATFIAAGLSVPSMKAMQSQRGVQERNAEVWPKQERTTQEGREGVPLRGGRSGERGVVDEVELGCTR